MGEIIVTKMDAVLNSWTLLLGIQIQSGYSECLTTGENILAKHVCDSLLDTVLKVGYILGSKMAMRLGITNIKILNFIFKCY